MPIYTVDISCRSTGHDYSMLFNSLRDANAVSFMDSRWLLDVQEELSVVTEKLLGHCAPGDRLFVTELSPATRWSGTGLQSHVKAWLLERMVRGTTHETSTRQ